MRGYSNEKHSKEMHRDRLAPFYKVEEQGNNTNGNNANLNDCTMTYSLSQQTFVYKYMGTYMYCSYIGVHLCTCVPPVVAVPSSVHGTSLAVADSSICL